MAISERPEQAIRDGQAHPSLTLRQHPILYWRAVAWASVALLLAVVALASGAPLFWGVAATLFAAASLVAAIEATVRRRTVELTIDERRVTLSSGVFRRRVVEAFPGTLAAVEISQGPLGRAWNYGWVRIPALGGRPGWLALAEPAQVRAAIGAMAAAPAVAVEEAPEPQAAPLPAAEPVIVAASDSPRLAPAPLARPRRVNGARRRDPNAPAAPILLRPQASLDRF